MPDDLDTTDDQTSFASARVDAWHGLGTVTDDALTAVQAMTEARLGGWNIRKLPITGEDVVTGNDVDLQTHMMTVRDNPVRKGQVDPLGIVGRNYEVVQNEEQAEFLDALVDEAGAHYETAGALDGGRKVFLTMKLPTTLQIGGVDPIDLYLAAINSHDGSMAFTAMATGVRIVCRNTLNMALRRAKNKFTVRHTKGVRASIAEARRVLDLTFKYDTELETEAERMVQTALTEAKFMDLVSKEFGAPKDAAKATITRAEQRLDEIQRLFVEAPTQEAVRDTVWAGLNALTEYADHHSPVRGEERDTRRHYRAIFEPAFKERAYKLLSSVR